MNGPQHITKGEDMTDFASQTCSPAHSSPSARRTRLGLHIVLNWIDASRSRRALRSLPAAALHDIGLTQTQARIEAGRPFWQAPQIHR